MSAKTYGWAVFIWTVLMFIDAIGQGAMGDTSDLITVLTLKVLHIRPILGVPLPIPNLEWFDAVWTLLSWDFFYFDNDFGMWLRLFVCLPIMGLLLWGFVTVVLPVVLSGASALITFLVNVASLINPLRFFGGA